MILKKDTLWEGIVHATKHALSTGALVPIRTDQTFIEDGGMRFSIRVLAALQRKDEAKKKQAAGSLAGNTTNPFLPPEKDLLVGDISKTHLAVLNKYNVVEHHLLIVTREFEDQDMLLTPADCEALWNCMLEYDSLAFYNGGRAAGASQQHKHLQLVPLPLTQEGPSVPIEPLLENASAHRVGTVPGLPFRHSFVRLNRDRMSIPPEASQMLFNLYAELLQSSGLAVPNPDRLVRQSMPYCFLATRDWMLLVPRSCEHFEDISLNSLAFAGSFFVRDEKQLARLRNSGPMQALRSVTL